jgi:hypothetical protein
LSWWLWRTLWTHIRRWGRDPGSVSSGGEYKTILLEDKVVGESRWRICCCWWDGENRAPVKVPGFNSGTTVEVWSEVMVQEGVG